MFHGQYESAVQCVRCNVVSRTYDPFMYLSLPLPQQSNAPKFPIVFLGLHEHARLFSVDPNEVRENGVITAIGLKRFVSRNTNRSLSNLKLLIISNHVCTGDVLEGNRRIDSHLMDPNLVAAATGGHVLFAYVYNLLILRFVCSKKKYKPQTQQIRGSLSQISNT